MSATCCISPSVCTRKNDYPLGNIPPIRKLFPFWLWRFPNLRVMGKSKFDRCEGKMGDGKVLRAHLTQQIRLLVRRHKIRNVIGVLGPWDVVLSKVHL
jgi:hypothetical protein